ncbi:MAG: tRNA (guanosine(37)-N1)-methyltransferase TrmD [Ruminococcaceae bacterium]|nr:tRNA (guanosine(37)-N1)-methyltransferase TrmD [Oscillospiraceae bacterium]
MRFDIMTLFPDMLETIFNESIIGRARKKGLIEIVCHNIRDYSEDKHRKVDDTSYGGGMGMLMAAPPISNCYDAIVRNIKKKPHTIYVSPKGRTFNHKVAEELLNYDEINILCGHYEGIDQRIIDEIVDEEISLGDFVLTGGELPAAIIVDAVSRLVEGVLPSKECHEKESIASGLLEYPQYTRPVEFHGVRVPDVLLSGNHADIEMWRFERSLEITREKRPDLYEKIDLEEKKKQVKEYIINACTGGNDDGKKK